MRYNRKADYNHHQHDAAYLDDPMNEAPTHGNTVRNSPAAYVTRKGS